MKKNRYPGHKEWLDAQEKKRRFVAAGIASGIYAIAFLALLVFSRCAVSDYGEFAGPVLVRIGQPDGLDLPTPPAPGDSAEIPQPGQPDPAEPRTDGDAESPRQAQSPDAGPAPAEQPASTPAPTQPVLPENYEIKGNEKGNNYELTMDGSPNTVSRSFSVPIYLYMPLPTSLPYYHYDFIDDLPGLPDTKADRQKEFESVYELKNQTWALRSSAQSIFDIRPSIWIILEETGYSFSDAEYKRGKNLSPVEILFKVSTYSDARGVVLEEAQILPGRGSGDKKIDEAVLYAFKKAGFSNSGGKSISGRFIYKF